MLLTTNDLENQAAIVRGLIDAAVALRARIRDEVPSPERLRTATLAAGVGGPVFAALTRDTKARTEQAEEALDLAVAELRYTFAKIRTMIDLAEVARR